MPRKDVELRFGERFEVGRIAIGWPRIPMPGQRANLESSVLLGKRIADLLDPETPVTHVTSGKIYEHNKVLGAVSAVDLTISAGWGYKDKQGHINPGQGTVKQRPYSTSELEALSKGANEIGMSLERAIELLGSPLDIYLNETTHWKCVPSAVWEYVIGGYQIIKKWLSYRDVSVMDRPLSKEEAREVTSMVRRIAAIILMTDTLNSNYISSRDNNYSWPTKK